MELTYFIYGHAVGSVVTPPSNLCMEFWARKAVVRVFKK